MVPFVDPTELTLHFGADGTVQLLKVSSSSDPAPARPPVGFSTHPLPAALEHSRLKSEPAVILKTLPLVFMVGRVPSWIFAPFLYQWPAADAALAATAPPANTTTATTSVLLNMDLI
jgi:hypothetical protein